MELKELYTRLEETMRRHPDRTLSEGARVMTYAEALAEAGRRAKALKREKYGILCRSELNTALNLLACLAAGKTAVPLSSRYGERHARSVVRAVGLSCLLTDEGVRAIGEETPEIEDLRDVPLLMCTSGTTGSPKGAMITNDNIVSNLRDIEGYFSIGAADRILIARPLYHCAVLTGEFFISLLKGLDIVFAEGAFNPVQIAAAVREEGITVLCGTPTLLYHLCRAAGRSSSPLSLRTVAVSGECMTRAVADLLTETLPHTAIYNVYGLTEASPRVAYLDPSQFSRHPETVGAPLRSVEVRLDHGELLVRGPNVMRGYYNNPEATARTIVDGWLHTGDLADRDGEGRLTVRARKDDLIIRAGMNIYPQEIENALRRDPDVSDAMAYGAAGAVIGQRIHLQVVARGLTGAEVFDRCRRLLPSYQLPDDIQIVEELPRNASGKLLRPRPGAAERLTTG